jgi:hypothetical protein
MKRRLRRMGGECSRIPLPGGGTTYVRNDDPARANVRLFSSFPGVTLDRMETYSDAKERLPERQHHYAHISTGLGKGCDRCVYRLLQNQDRKVVKTVTGRRRQVDCIGPNDGRAGARGRQLR